MASQKKKFAFTKRKLEAIAAPSNGKRVYYQDETEGLFLCVTKSGAKTFYAYRWFQGRPVRVPLGKFPTMSVEQARKACRALVTAMASGIDVQQARQAARHEHTLAGLWEFWLEHAKQRKKTWEDDQKLYERFLMPWANRRLSAISKADVTALHAKIGKDNGPYQANRVLALVGAMFGKATDIGFVGLNPARGVQKFKETKRDRFLQGDELPKFFKSLASEPNPIFCDFFVLAILTGARRANMEAMAWANIDLEQAYWRIPQTKSGLPVVVPLVPAAVAILRHRRQAANGSPWVFPSRSATGHITEPTAAWRRLLKRAGLADLRIHDLRRSLGSWQAMGGASLPVIGKSLGHTQASTTMIYARLALDPVRTSVESATTAILEAASVAVDDQGAMKLLAKKGDNHGDDGGENTLDAGNKKQN